MTFLNTKTIPCATCAHVDQTINADEVGANWTEIKCRMCGEVFMARKNFVTGLFSSKMTKTGYEKLNAKIKAYKNPLRDS